VRLRSGHPAYSSGVRTALGVAVPLLVGIAAGNETAALGASFGGLMVSLADTGGAYGTRARMTISAVILGAAEVFVASLAANNGWLAAATMFLVAGATGFSAAFGPHAGPLGLTMALTYAITLGLPQDLAGAAASAGWFLAGGAWAVTLSLVLWAGHRWSPLVEAIAQTYRAVAQFARVTLPGAPGVGPWEEQVRAARQRVRQARSQAEDELAVVSIDKTTSSAGARLRALVLRQASLVFNGVVALAEALQQTRHAAESISAAQFPEAIDAVADRLAAAGPRSQDRSLAAAPTRRVAALPDNVGELAASLSAEIDRAARLVAQLPGSRDTTLDPGQAQALAFEAALLRRPRLWPTIRANLTGRSDVGRHCLRLACTCAVGVGMYSLLGLEHGYWIPLTIVIVLKPDIGATFDRTVQRIVGTLTGAVLAAILAATVTTAWGAALLTAPLAFAMVTFVPYNYVFWTIFITPLIILLQDTGDPGDWTVVGWRILNTLIGCTLGLLGGYLLWPSWQRRTLPVRIAALLAAEQQLLDAVARARPTPDEHNTAAIHRLARQAVMASTNVDEGIKRLVMEPVPARSDVAAAVNLAEACRHSLDVLFVLQLRTLTPARVPAVAGDYPDAGDEGAQLAALLPCLAGLEDAVRGRSHPEGVDAWPRPDPGSDAGYLMEQLRGVATAVDRWLTPG